MSINVLLDDTKKPWASLKGIELLECNSVDAGDISVDTELSANTVTTQNISISESFNFLLFNALSTVNGIGNGNTITVSCYKINNIVTTQLTGLIGNASATTANFGTLPQGLRPISVIKYVLSTGFNSTNSCLLKIIIDNTGRITIRPTDGNFSDQNFTVGTNCGWASLCFSYPIN